MTVVPVPMPCGRVKQIVSAPLQLIAAIVPSDSGARAAPCCAVSDRVPPACTKPPVIVAATVDLSTDFAVKPAWMSMRPPEAAYANESASLTDWAITVTSWLAVTLPPPIFADTVGCVFASAVEPALIAATPMDRLSTLALVASSAIALTSIARAPASPTVPTAGSMWVEPTLPLSSALVTAWSSASG